MASTSQITRRRHRPGRERYYLSLREFQEMAKLQGVGFRQAMLEAMTEWMERHKVNVPRHLRRHAMGPVKTIQRLLSEAKRCSDHGLSDEANQRIDEARELIGTLGFHKQRQALLDEVIDLTGTKR